MNIAPIILAVITALSPLTAPTTPPEPVGQQTPLMYSNNRDSPTRNMASRCGITLPNVNLAAIGTSTPLMVSPWAFNLHRLRGMRCAATNLRQPHIRPHVNNKSRQVNDYNIF